MHEPAGDGYRLVGTLAVGIGGEVEVSFPVTFDPAMLTGPHGNAVR